MSSRKPRLAVTVGDPRGIGPEVVAAALPFSGAETTVIGPADSIRGMAADHAVALDAWNGARFDDLERAGKLTAGAVEEAVRLWKSGGIDAIVTGPGDKRALNAAGYRFPGHTELLRDLTGARHVAMMLAADKLRVVLVTTHLALRDAMAILTAERIEQVAAVTRRGLAEWFGIPDARLALCAVNPHAGEGGLFGHEEEQTLRPAARKVGLAGPLSADTVFVRAMRGEFDAVLTPFHDVGMTAVKVAAFGRGVNVTLGLPVPRTAPDHGTALDIAGRGVADPTSMKEAVAVAAAIAGRIS